MTLDEAIKHCEEVANDRAGCCEDCAEEHRQLAEWLKDYKRLKEREPCDDCISRQAVLDITWEEPSYTDAMNVLTEVRDKVKELPSVNPQIICPIHGVYCEDCSAYEKKLNKWIGAEVLDRIRNEMHATAEKHEDGAYYLRDEWVDEIIDKYAEGSEKE